MRRLKQHFVTLPCGVDVILGTNGYIWITEAMDDEVDDLVDARSAEVLETRRKRAASRVIGPDARRRMARVRNAITALRTAASPITPDTIMATYHAMA